MKITARPIAAIFLNILCGAALAGVLPGEVLLKIPSNLQFSGGHFGFAIAADGNNVAVGSPRDTYASRVSAGSVQLFNQSGDAVARFEDPGTVQVEQFGGSVAVDGGRYLVGARYADVDTIRRGGVAHFISGKIDLPIPNPSPEVEDFFGQVVALSGNHLFIGAPQDNPGGSSNAGSVFMYDDQGILLHVFSSPELIAGELFGSSIAVLPGGRLAIGAPGHFQGAQQLGTVYIYDADTASPGFTQGIASIARPEPPYNFAQYLFGSSLAVEGNDLWIGDPSGGTVFAYDVNPQTDPYGQLRGTINSPAPYNYSRFGDSLAVKGGRLVVGAPYLPLAANTFEYSGGIFVYDTNPQATGFGIPLATMVNPEAPLPTDSSRYFGQSVAILDNGVIAASAYLQDESKGAVFLFQGGFTEPQLVNMTFEVNPAASQFFVDVEGAPGMTFNFSPSVSGTLDTEMLQSSGKPTAFRVIGIDMRAGDITSKIPFPFTLTGLRAVMDQGRGAPGAIQPISPFGQFIQFGNQFGFDGVADVTIGEQSFHQEGGAGTGYSTFDFTGRVEQDKSGGIGLVVPFSLGRTIPWGSGPFSPSVHGSGTLAMAQEGTLPTPTATPEPTFTPTPTATPAAGSVLSFLLGLNANPAGLDLNGDSEIDAADLLIEVTQP